jgi:hypothetical protein
MYSELICVSNRPPLGVKLDHDYHIFSTNYNVAKQAKVSKMEMHGSFRSLEVYGEV